MYVLGIDACLGECSVALMAGDSTLALCRESMARGHVERLAPMVAEVLSDAGIGAPHLDLIGVTCGPGGFTGARLGVSFARGLALASGCRSVGVTTLEALAFPHAPRPLIVALDGRRGDLFVQAFDADGPIGEAGAIEAPDLPVFVAKHGAPCVIGPEDVPPIDPVDVARIARGRAHDGPPRPLYLRLPDAKAAARPILR